MTVTELSKIATTFRLAIIQSNAKPEYPVGCCKVVSIMLAKHLVEDYAIKSNEIAYIQAIGEGDYENNNVPDGHFWLDLNGVYVDITANQFPEISQTVVVTTEWFWQNRFQEKKMNKYSYDDLSLSGFHLDTYIKIKSALSSVQIFM